MFGRGGGRGGRVILHHRWRLQLTWSLCGRFSAAGEEIDTSERLQDVFLVLWGTDTPPCSHPGMEKGAAFITWGIFSPNLEGFPNRATRFRVLSPSVSGKRRGCRSWLRGELRLPVEIAWLWGRVLGARREGRVPPKSRLAQGEIPGTFSQLNLQPNYSRVVFI